MHQKNKVNRFDLSCNQNFGVKGINILSHALMMHENNKVNTLKLSCYKTFMIEQVRSILVLDNFQRTGK